MKDFILGTLFGGGLVCGVYFGWVTFNFEFFGISINSDQLENASAAQCRAEIKRANQRAFASDRAGQAHLIWYKLYLTKKQL
ncbi:hypothetical protein [Laspinema olomoucense]|uniref:Uncharacterized protein n=1 Tax=Laspinema olomoucense D3b TaxID=2953688 RepID=A0ABT2NFH2_9CYAN|nr:hypothetical protein [Laspinema sp. D3b]MCT7981447.1 hypothetical protein [Laspinema sp. D3b]